MSQFKWYRLYHEMPFDPKLRHVFTPADWWAWVCFMCMASAGEPRGKVPKNVANNVLADTARISEESAGECIEKFVSLGLLSVSKSQYSLVAWEKRQFQSDVSTPRVKRYRERSSNAEGNAPEYRVQSTEYREQRTEGQDTYHSREISDRLMGEYGNFPTPKQLEAIFILADRYGDESTKRIDYGIKAAADAGKPNMGYALACAQGASKQELSGGVRDLTA